METHIITHFYYSAFEDVEQQYPEIDKQN